MNDFDKFVKNVKASIVPMVFVGAWLVSKGYTIRISGVKIASRPDELTKFVDKGDMFLLHNGKEFKIEAKKLGAKFSCAEDWPFKDEMMVCSKRSWDRADPKPHNYILLSSDWKYVAIINGRSSNNWTVQKKKDKRYNKMIQDFYICPTKLVKFKKFDI